MAFVPQNFVAKVGPLIKAAWLNPLDVTVNSVLGGAQTVPAALTALGVDVALPRVIKPAATSRTSNVVLAADPDLQLAVAAAGYYRFEIGLGMAGGAGGATPGISLAASFTGTLAHSSAYNYFGNMNSTGVSGGQAIGTGSGFSLAASTANSLILIGYFQSSGAGTFELQWSQQNTSASATIVSPGSYLTLLQLA